MAGEFKISVQGNLDQAVARLEVDVGNQIALAAARALNRAATSTRAEAARRIRDTYNIKVGVARDQMRIARANRNRLVAEIVVSGRPIPLLEFAARAVNPWNVKGRKRRPGGGVSVQIKAGSRKLRRGAFIAQMKTGHRGVFERKAGGRIRELFSLSLPSMFTQKQIREAVERVALERFGIELQRELRYRTGG